MPEFTLSPHAVQRVTQRTQLSPDEVTLLLNRLDPIFTGYQTTDNRVHIVFYSVPDARCFFAVANMRDGAVATILTFGQYRWRYGPVSDGVLIAAKRRVLPAVAEPALGLIFTARVYVDGITATRNLGRVLECNVTATPEALAEDPELQALLRQRCAERGIDFATVLSIGFRVAYDSAPTELPLDLPGADAVLRQRWARSLPMGVAPS